MNARPEHLYPVRAERATIGQVMLRGDSEMTVIRSTLRVEDYCDSQSKAAFQALLDLDAAGKIPVGEDLGLFELWDQIQNNGASSVFPGGMEDLDAFKYDGPALGSEASSDAPARLVARGSTLRKAAARAESAAQAIRTRAELAEDATGRTFLDRVGADFSLLAEGGISSTPSHHISVACSDHELRMAERLAGRPGVVPTGFADVDSLLPGGPSAADGDFVILAGRPSMGKTAVLSSLIRNQNIVVRNPSWRVCQEVRPWHTVWTPRSEAYPILMASAEMSQTQLLDRQISDLVSLDSKVIQQPAKYEVWPKVAPLITAARHQVSSWPVEFVDRPNILEEIERAAKQWRSRHPVLGMSADGKTIRQGPAMLMVDHLGLIRMAAGKPKDTSDAKYVGQITKRLKDIGRRLKIVVVLLVQINRGVEGRTDKRPMMSDLRDSGEIEEDADTIGFIYRDSYYGTGDKSEQSRWGQLNELLNRPGKRTPQEWSLIDELERAVTGMEIILRKVRQGSTGTAYTRFYRHFTRIVDGPKNDYYHQG